MQAPTGTWLKQNGNIYIPESIKLKYGRFYDYSFPNFLSLFHIPSLTGKLKSITTAAVAINIEVPFVLPD